MAIGEVPEFARKLSHQLQRLDWAVEAKGPEREWPHARVVATHKQGFKLYVLADRKYSKQGRSVWRRRKYFIGLPQQSGRHRWHSLSLESLLIFASRPELPPPQDATPSAAPEGQGCKCNRDRLSKEEAQERLLQAKIRRADGNERRRERRAYPCNDDPQVFHLTSRG